jgi:hypothetical protein
MRGRPRTPSDGHGCAETPLSGRLGVGLGEGHLWRMKHASHPPFAAEQGRHRRSGHAGATRATNLDARLKRIALIARATDTMVAVPGTDVKLGLDAVIGAVPVAGDLVMACASAVLIHDAWRLGVPRQDVARMALNAGLDAAIGSVPFIGDLFDLVYRANERNLRIVERHLGRLDAPVVEAR